MKISLSGMRPQCYSIRRVPAPFLFTKKAPVIILGQGCHFRRLKRDAPQHHSGALAPRAVRRALSYWGE